MTRQPRLFVRHADGSTTELDGQLSDDPAPGALVTYRLATPYRTQPGDVLTMEWPLPEGVAASRLLLPLHRRP